MSGNIRDFFKSAGTKTSDSKGKLPPAQTSQEKSQNTAEKGNKSKSKTREAKSKESKKNEQVDKEESKQPLVQITKRNSQAANSQSQRSQKDKHDVEMEEPINTQRSNKGGKQSKSKTPIKASQQSPSKNDTVGSTEKDDEGIQIRKSRKIIDDESEDDKQGNRMNKKREQSGENEDKQTTKRKLKKLADKDDSDEEQKKDQKQQSQKESSQLDQFKYTPQKNTKSSNFKNTGVSPKLEKMNINEREQKLASAVQSQHSQIKASQGQQQSQKSNGKASAKQPAQKPIVIDESDEELMEIDDDALRDAVLDMDDDMVKSKPQSSKPTPKQTPKPVEKQPISSKPQTIQQNTSKQMKQEVKDPLKGLTFVVSGEFELITREKLKQLIVDKGGRTTDAVSGKTDILVVGYKLEDGRDVTQGQKYSKASQLGKKIMTESEFEEFVRDKSSNPEFTLSTRKVIMQNPPVQQQPASKVMNEESKENFTNEMWTDLYQPKEMGHLVGNEGVVNDLYEWLKDWDDVQIRGNKRPVAPRRGQSWQNMPNINAKAVLLSGPPGIGKTSAARIVCRQLGYEVLETNASDTRNKNSIENMLRTLSSNQSLDYFSVSGLKKQQDVKNPLASVIGGLNSKKSVIIMDEVDGVGSGDRGGIAALISVIKLTKTPIICICNDRMNQKLQSLVNHCYDLKFQRPSKETIIKRINMICTEQGLKIDRETLEKVIESSGQDIRQIINILQMWKNRQLDKSFLKSISKDEKVMISNFDAAHRLLDHGKKNLNINYPSFQSKMDLFFIDYDFIPLLMQENYLTAMGDAKGPGDIERMAAAADFISIGDCVNNQVRSQQDWTLLSNLGVTSSIAPALLIQGSSFYPRFPEWLGKNSSQRKSKRLIRELKKVMGHNAQASRLEIQNEYVELILTIIYKFMKSGKDHLEEAVEFMEHLGLTNEHLKEHLMGLSMDPKIVKAFEDLDSQTKSAFTREYNKKHKDPTAGKKGKKTDKNAATSAENDVDNEEQVEEEDEQNGLLIDEEQLNDLKKGKQLEKLESEKGKVDKAEKIEMLQIHKKEETKKGGKQPAKSQGKAAKKGGKGGKNQQDYDEDMSDDDIKPAAKKKQANTKSGGTRGKK